MYDVRSKTPTLSIDVKLLEGHSCQISSQSVLKIEKTEPWALLKMVAPTARTTTIR